MFETFPHRTDEARALPVAVQTIAERHAEWETRPHGHLFFEIIAVTEGDAKSSAFAIPPGAIHDCREFGVEDGLVVRFLPDGVDDTIGYGLSLQDDIPAGLLFDPFRRPVLDLLLPIALPEAAHAGVLALLLQMREELHARRQGYDIVVRSALHMLLVELARNAPGTGAAPFAPASRELVRRVFADIDAHFHESGLLAAAAQRLDLGPAYLTTRLRRLTGRTYGDWVIERRMIEARRLLIVSDRSVAAIAEQVGYGESESFIRRFRDRHGLTPAAWREKSRSVAT